jgi:hypothetical protein
LKSETYLGSCHLQLVGTGHTSPPGQLARANWEMVSGLAMIERLNYANFNSVSYTENKGYQNLNWITK